MRYSPAEIRQFLDQQPASGLTVATFCEDHSLKVPTFYSWKRKYKAGDVGSRTGFFEITPRRVVADRTLKLPSGLRVELQGLSTSEIAELILEIDRAHA